MVAEKPCRWGYNAYGELGDGSTTQRTTPVRVRDDANFVEVAAAHYNTCARRANGTVWCWGYNGYGEIGDGTTTHRSQPRQKSGVDDAAGLFLPGWHRTCILRENGTVWCSGYNAHGSLGDGTTTHRSQPVQVLGVANVVSVSQGTSGYGNMVTTADNETYVWGRNYNGSLGIGNANTQAYTRAQRLPGF